MPTPPRPEAVAMAAIVSGRSDRSGLGVVGGLSTTDHPRDLPLLGNG